MFYELEEVLEVASRAGIYEDSVLADYSGRGMFGKSCLGIVCHIGDLLAFVVEVENCGGMITDDFFAVASDNMGLGTVLYWPHIQVGTDNSSEADPWPDKEEVA